MFNLIAHKINDEYSDFLDTHFYTRLMGQSRNNDLLAQRKEQLSQIAQLLRRDSDYYAKVLTKDMGKLFTEAKGKITLCADIADYYAEKTETFLK
ncbi:hypothetical protein CIRMBP1310_01412 [Enterococcus cecorum]|nr:hypothetical protein AA986_03800 [Enterococcus cecorum]CAI3294574.1 hypothetical protein CIRMBP1274_00567 [Enterococcus cecorum]CAI3296308.1 hypothetical protein CIRMBP1283_00540 [Enterococcus cecorum]CAI3314519.1 hypothetical protein CIRMBP1276_00684 [Enterococcus cecorum]CAI3321407.1 hypothetical protein CIRMBP1250_00877 [Enterococcus cecorum]